MLYFMDCNIDGVLDSSGRYTINSTYLRDQIYVVCEIRKLGIFKMMMNINR